MLSRRITSQSHAPNALFEGMDAYQMNAFDPVENPSGIIQMGLAENQVSSDVMESRIAKNRGSEWIDPTGHPVYKDIAQFQDFRGLPACKEVMANYLSEVRQNKVTFDPNKLVLTAGATAANETVVFCLAGKGDALLIPTPYYPGFDRDLKWRTDAEIVPINCFSSNNFMITKEALESAYERAGNLNLRVIAVFVTNPSNPLGTSLTREEINLLVEFSDEKDIHIVSDEIYAGTVFRSPNYTSILEALEFCQQDSSLPSRVHCVFSLSKDMGLPGFRVGMIYSNNETLVWEATKMASFGLVSSQTQLLVSELLGDKKFVKKYLKENRTRLRNRRKMVVSGLLRMGIPCLKGNAGLFVWADMRHLLVSESFEAEEWLWKRMLRDFGLNVTPGSSCHCSEPGWFRVCFGNVAEETLDLAMERMKTMVETMMK